MEQAAVAIADIEEDAFAMTGEHFHREQNLSNTEHGFFAINWDYPLSEIRRAFCEWLKERETERKVEPRFSPSPSRGQFRDKLRWLGALRVKNYYRNRDLVGYIKSNLKVDAPYCHYPDLCEAAKKAKDLISVLFPSEKEAAQIASEPLKHTPLTAEDLALLNRTAAEIRRKSSTD